MIMILRNLKLLARTNYGQNRRIIFSFSSTHSIIASSQRFSEEFNSLFTRQINLNAFKNAKLKTDDSLSKSKIISDLNFKSKEDAEPFYKLSIKMLLHIYKVTQNDNKNGFCSNRLYYLSSKIKCQPSTLSECLIRRTFIYSLSFEWLEKSLKILLDMNVSGDRILRDLWVLKYHHKTIEERLMKIKKLGVDNLFPWMVRCTEDILNRSVQISQEKKTILGDNKSTTMYLASRLNTSQEFIEDMYLKIPALKTTRVTKVKNFLDFLINEGYTVQEIANKPRILSASQKTVKQRLEKLRALGLCEINLNVLCRSRKDFQRYCESIESASTEE